MSQKIWCRNLLVCSLSLLVTTCSLAEKHPANTQPPVTVPLPTRIVLTPISYIFTSMLTLLPTSTPVPAGKYAPTPQPTDTVVPPTAVPFREPYTGDPFSVITSGSGNALWRINSSNNERKLLLQLPEGASIREYSLSHDAKQLLYLTNIEENTLLNLLNLESGQSQVLASSTKPNIITNIDWCGPIAAYNVISWQYLNNPSQVTNYVRINPETGKMISLETDRLNHCSPNGRYILSGSFFRNIDVLPYLSQYHLYDTVTGESRIVTENGELASFNSWSPDSSKMLFDVYPVDDWENAQLIVVDVATLSRKMLSEPKMSASGVSWSPDNQWISYIDCGTSLSGCQCSKLKLVSVDGSVKRDVPLGEQLYCSVSHPPAFNEFTMISRTAWSKDGAYIILICDESVWVVKPDNSGLRPLITESDGHLYSSVIAPPVVTVAAQEETPIPLAVKPFLPELAGVAPQPFHIFTRDGGQIWRISSDGSDRQLIIDTYESAGLYLLGGDLEIGDRSKIYHPLSWGDASPDGTRLALGLTDKLYMGNSNEPYKLWVGVFDISSKELRVFDNGLNPVWAPDGVKIAYTGQDNGLWVYNTGTGERKKLLSISESSFLYNIVWSDNSERISAIQQINDGTQFLVAISANGKGESVIFDISTARRIAKLAWLQDNHTLLLVTGKIKPYHDSELSGISLIDTENLSHTQLMTDFQIGSFAVFPHNDNWLIFLGRIPFKNILTRPYEGTAFDLWLYNYKENSIIRLTQNISAPEEFVDIQFSPDGNSAVFSHHDLGIRTFNLADGSMHDLYSFATDFLVAK